MKNSRLKLGIIVAIVSLVFAVWQFVRFDKETDESFNKMMREFPLLLIKDSINSEVSVIFPKKDVYNPYFVNITIQNNEKLTIYSIRCLSDPNKELEEVINIGTKLTKEKGSNLLKISNKNLDYIFEIDDDLFKKGI